MTALIPRPLLPTLREKGGTRSAGAACRPGLAAGLASARFLTVAVRTQRAEHFE